MILHFFFVLYVLSQLFNLFKMLFGYDVGLSLSWSWREEKEDEKEEGKRQNVDNISPVHFKFVKKRFMSFSLWCRRKFFTSSSEIFCEFPIENNFHVEKAIKIHENFLPEISEHLTTKNFLKQFSRSNDVDTKGSEHSIVYKTKHKNHHHHHHHGNEKKTRQNTSKAENCKMFLFSLFCWQNIFVSSW